MVGQEEDTGALVSGANVTRSNAGPSAAVAEALELGADGGKSGSCSADVLPDTPFGLALADDADELEEEAGAGAVEPGALPGKGEVLAGRAANDSSHASAPWVAVEGSGIAPHRSVIQRARLDTCNQRRDGRCFPLHVADGASAWNCQPDSGVKASSAGADGDIGLLFGR